MQNIATSPISQLLRQATRAEKEITTALDGDPVVIKSPQRHKNRLEYIKADSKPTPSNLTIKLQYHTRKGDIYTLYLENPTEIAKRKNTPFMDVLTSYITEAVNFGRTDVFIPNSALDFLAERKRAKREFTTFLGMVEDSVKIEISALNLKPPITITEPKPIIKGVKVDRRGLYLELNVYTRLFRANAPIPKGFFELPKHIQDVIYALTLRERVQRCKAKAGAITTSFEALQKTPLNPIERQHKKGKTIEGVISKAVAEINKSEDLDFTAEIESQRVKTRPKQTPESAPEKGNKRGGQNL